MELAHLILAHTGPKQLERLVKHLTYPGASVYIHVDKKTPLEPFEHLKNYPNVYFVKNRIKVYWGTYNIVEATLNGFAEIIASGNDFKYINLLSGQDYPLQPQKYIHQFLSANQGTLFMNYLQFEPDWVEGFSRIDSYHFNNLSIKGKFLLQKIVNKFSPKRIFPNKLVPVGRSQWFTIPAECVSYALDYWNSNKKLRNFIKLTWAPDEFIFHTILFNSKYKEKMVNNNLRYINWEPGKVSPKTLTIEDAENIFSSGKLFARKFDINVDYHVLDLIDEHIKVALI